MGHEATSEPDRAGSHQSSEYVALDRAFWALEYLREVARPGATDVLDPARRLVYRELCRLGVQPPADVPPGLTEAEERALWGDR